MIVTYAHRYRPPPKRRKPQPPLPVRIVTAKSPKPVKLRRQGVMVEVPAIVRPKSVSVPTRTIVRPVTAKQKRWHAMRERMGLEP
jgi:hypothetical protein